MIKRHRGLPGHAPRRSSSRPMAKATFLTKSSRLARREVPRSLQHMSIESGETAKPSPRITPRGSPCGHRAPPTHTVKAFDDSRQSFTSSLPSRQRGSDTRTGMPRKSSANKLHAPRRLVPRRTKSGTSAARYQATLRKRFEFGGASNAPSPRVRFARVGPRPRGLRITRKSVVLPLPSFREGG